MMKHGLIMKQLQTSNCYLEIHASNETIYVGTSQNHINLNIVPQEAFKYFSINLHVLREAIKSQLQISR